MATENHPSMVYTTAENQSSVEEKERLHEEDLRRIRELRLMDDDFMNICLDGYIEGVELILRIILGRDDIRVISVKAQQLMKSLTGRDIWLDILAVDADNREIDVEVQRADKGASNKRARYHSAMLDSHMLRSGEDFEDLKDSYVIFITENDLKGRGESIYPVERWIDVSKTERELFRDGAHIIYVNGAKQGNETALEKLMHDFSCMNASDMYYPVLATKVRYYKEDEKGVGTMCKALEDMRNEAVEKATQQIQIANAKVMLADGILTVEQAAKYFNLPIDLVRKLAGEIGA